ncbi:MAG: hypothetical protein JNJ59_17040 [Deltaproteobacteria bacterium]|nr:hypothetical protein [Deltaproteobacteria bacterium]
MRTWLVGLPMAIAATLGGTALAADDPPVDLSRRGFFGMSLRTVPDVDTGGDDRIEVGVSYDVGIRLDLLDGDRRGMTRLRLLEGTFMQGLVAGKGIELLAIHMSTTRLPSAQRGSSHVGTWFEALRYSARDPAASDRLPIFRLVGGGAQGDFWSNDTLSSWVRARIGIALDGAVSSGSDFDLPYPGLTAILGGDTELVLDGRGLQLLTAGLSFEAGTLSHAALFELTASYEVMPLGPTVPISICARGRARAWTTGEVLVIFDLGLRLSLGDFSR